MAKKKFVTNYKHEHRTRNGLTSLSMSNVYLAPLSLKLQRKNRSASSLAASCFIF